VGARFTVIGKYFEITARGIALKTVREKGLFTALRLARKRKRGGLWLSAGLEDSILWKISGRNGALC
jgi:hypothetical protein